MKSKVVGIDVSKETLDLVITHRDRIVSHDQISNSIKELKNYLQIRLTQLGVEKSDWCMYGKHWNLL